MIIAQTAIYLLFHCRERDNAGPLARGIITDRTTTAHAKAPPSVTNCSPKFRSNSAGPVHRENGAFTSCCAQERISTDYMHTACRARNAV